MTAQILKDFKLGVFCRFGALKSRKRQWQNIIYESFLYLFLCPFNMVRVLVGISILCPLSCQEQSCSKNLVDVSAPTFVRKVPIRIYFLTLICLDSFSTPPYSVAAQPNKDFMVWKTNSCQKYPILIDPCELKRNDYSCYSWNNLFALGSTVTTHQTSFFLQKFTHSAKVLTDSFSEHIRHTVL